MKLIKALGITFSFILLAASAFAETNEKTVSSQITDVTVFIQGAQIKRKASVQIPKGMSVIVFDDLANSIDPNSLQASGIGKFTISDIQYRYVHPEPVKPVEIPNSVKSKIERIEDSLRNIRLRQNLIQSRLNYLQREEQFIQQHPLINGKGDPDSLDLLVSASHFIKQKLDEIARRRFHLTKEQSDVGILVNALNVELRELRNYQSNQPQPIPGRPKHQILVHVVAETAVYGVVETSFFTRNAGWSPIYDVMASSVSEDLSLVYKARIVQNTGIDWSGVKLKISNANPNRNKIKPKLPTWYVRFFRQVRVEMSAYKKRPSIQTMDKIAAAESKEVEFVEDEEEIADYSDGYTQKMQNFSSVEFEIDLPYKIHSDGKSHFVVLKREKVKTKYVHHIVPKMEQSAFVIANLTDWRDMDLLVGQANVFFGNTFVGTTVIDPTILSDTMEVSLGRDERVRSERKKLKSSIKDKLLGNKKVYKAQYELVIRNTHSSDITLVVEDQIPVAAEQNIDVVVNEMDGAKLNERTGILTWETEVKGRAKWRRVFDFEIEYPEGERLQGI